MRCFVYLLSVVLLSSCSTAKQNTLEKDKFTPVYSIEPHILVYKTKKNFDKLVPIILSDDKSEIVSYPHPTDLKSGDMFLTPLKLKKGYLLDNKGINSNVAFLKWTYDEYSKFESAPDLKTLMDNIIDKNPLLELYDCGNKSNFINIEHQLNDLISTKQLQTKCKRLLSNER